MAVNDFWEMGIAVPIKNHKFRYGTWKSTTLSGAHDSVSSLTFADTTPDMDLIIKRGDSVMVGPSEDSSYEGKSEVANITTFTSTTANLKSTLNNNYDSGDNVRFYGQALAGGWTPGQSGSNRIVTPKSILTNTGGYSGGKVDRYAQNVIYDFSNADFSKQSHHFGYFDYIFNQNPFLNGVHYRAGIIYKIYAKQISGPDNCYLYVNLDDGNLQFIGEKDKTADSTSYTEMSTTTMGPRYPSSVNLDDADTGFLRIGAVGSNVSDYINLFIDDVYVEHAHETTPISYLTETIISTNDRINNINVLDSSNFIIGEGITIIDEENAQYGYGVIANIPDSKSISLSENMIFGYLNSNNQYEWQSNPIGDIAVGSRVQQANGGYYTFTEYPTRSSLNFEIINKEANDVLSNNVATKYYNTSLGDIGDRYKISCRFSNVPETMWNRLMVFLRAQKNGNMLNLHPKWNDVPPVMTGFMTISNMTKSESWDLTYRSFNFTFEEAI